MAEIMKLTKYGLSKNSIFPEDSAEFAYGKCLNVQVHRCETIIDAAIAKREKIMNDSRLKDSGKYSDMQKEGIRLVREFLTKEAGPWHQIESDLEAAKKKASPGAILPMALVKQDSAMFIQIDIANRIDRYRSVLADEVENSPTTVQAWLNEAARLGDSESARMLYAYQTLPLIHHLKMKSHIDFDAVLLKFWEVKDAESFAQWRTIESVYKIYRSNHGMAESKLFEVFESYGASGIAENLSSDEVKMLVSKTVAGTGPSAKAISK